MTTLAILLNETKTLRGEALQSERFIKYPETVILSTAKDPRSLEAATLSPTFSRHTPPKKLDGTRIVSGPKGFFATLRMTN